MFDLVTQSWFKRQFNSKILDVLTISEKILIIKPDRVSKLDENIFSDSGAMIIVNQMCGEFKFWREVAEKLSWGCGYKVAGTICIRSILPYIRLVDFQIDRIEKTNLGDG